GTPLEQVQAFLDPRGWQVPLASPWREMTVGEIVATNLNAPQRIRYGAVRDVLLCCTVALPDGRIVRAGRAVVKNVAGYDLPKAFVGSYGTLGLLTDATFKIVAKPRSKQTIVVPVDDLKLGLAWGSQLLQVALMASAVVLTRGVAVPGVSFDFAQDGPYALVYTAEGHEQDVEAEMTQVRALLQKLNAPTPRQISTTGTDLWCDLLRGATIGSLVVRVGVAPKDLADFARNQSARLDACSYLVDIASGLVYAVASPANVNEAKAWLAPLRQAALAIGGYAIVAQLPDEWRATIDRWGYRPDALDLMRALKARWDPAGILETDRFVA
ncbi:MAG: FAD-binding oxidoreductase, partial [Chloroflexota bacterium]